MLSMARRVYAPRYRSASSAVQATAPFYNWRRFNSTDERVHAALHLAYDDVERAFFQFLDERSPDSSRPIILASHSQGTMHLKRLLSRLPDSRHASALDRIAVAYLLGNTVEADEVPLPPCDSPTQTRCFVSWNAVLTNGTAGWYWRQKALRSNGSLPVCTNPLTWRDNGAFAEEPPRRRGANPRSLVPTVSRSSFSRLALRGWHSLRLPSSVREVGIHCRHRRRRVGLLWAYARIRLPALLAQHSSECDRSRQCLHWIIGGGGGGGVPAVR